MPKKEKKKKLKKRPAYMCSYLTAHGGMEVSLLNLVGKGDNIPMKLRVKDCGSSLNLENSH
jgi:hypothetical protein